MARLDNRVSKPEPERREADVNGVHRTHCCHKHGCKYGNDTCPVFTGEVPQAYRCEWCDDEIAMFWPMIEAANAAYDAGRAAGQTEGYEHGFAEGTFRGFRQGRIWAETGRLEPLGSLPWPQPHEVTTEMVEAFGQAWTREHEMAKAMGPGLAVEGSRRRAGLAAVLGILRRDASIIEGERT